MSDPWADSTAIICRTHVWLAEGCHLIVTRLGKLALNYADKSRWHCVFDMLFVRSLSSTTIYFLMKIR